MKADLRADLKGNEKVASWVVRRVALRAVSKVCQMAGL